MDCFGSVRKGIYCSRLKAATLLEHTGCGGIDERRKTRAILLKYHENQKMMIIIIKMVVIEITMMRMITMNVVTIMITVMIYNVRQIIRLFKLRGRQTFS